MRFLGNGQHILDIGNSIAILLLHALFVTLSGSFHFGFCRLAERGELFLQRRNDIGKGFLIYSLFQIVIFSGLGFIVQIVVVFLQQSCVFFCLAAIEPYDGIQVLKLPFAPFIQRSVHNCIVIPGIDEQNLIPDCFALRFIEKPQGARQRFLIEEIITDGDHHVNVTGLDELFTDILIFALTVGSGGCHNETGAAMLVQIRIEIGDP